MLKVFALLMLFSNAALASNEMFYSVDCTGITYEGEVYEMSAIYALDPVMLEQEAPFTIDVPAQNVLVDVNHVSAIFDDGFRLDITDDQTVFNFRSMNGDFLTIEPAPGESEEGDYVSFGIGAGWGTFRNAKCTMSGPEEDL